MIKIQDLRTGTVKEVSEGYARDQIERGKAVVAKEKKQMKPSRKRGYKTKRR